MVVVEYTYEEMKKLVNLPRDQLISTLSELGAPSEYEPETKKIITELTPNRPDWYSMEGLARALRSYYGEKISEYKTKKSDYVVVVDPSVASVRPYTVCAVVKKLSFDDQKIRDMVLLQEKLLATLGRKVKKFGLGIYPLHGIKFPINYTTKKPEEIAYRPLGHETVMTAEEIIKKHKKGQQYGYLLQGKARYPIFTDSNGKIMALIPIVNSAETGKVDEDTREVFIEVSGSDLHMCKVALNILVCTFADMGGEIYEVRMEYQKEKFVTPNLVPQKIKINLVEINRILGVVFTEKQITQFLKKMGYGYEHGVVSIPPFRADIMGQIDIVEDIAIAHGYNNFKPTMPNFFTSGNRIRKYDSIDEIMKGMGFLELKTFTLTNKEKLHYVGSEETVVEITNPNTVDFTIVRPNLMVSFLDVLVVNKMKGLPQKFYEIGEVHRKKTTKKLVFGVVDKKLDFSEVRGYLQTLASECGFEFKLNKKPNKVFESELSCVILVKNKEIGVFGKIKKEILSGLGLENEVYVCELET
ncbi:Phenylalanine--tRNA ligase beta subunit [Candidatus Bilamarchaeum dharawalense]|uniref:phenylalanine--tRNA ligase n=1 Tax=Candidatus Bilamarchaeum dharawalense TaxID=2885759 RepID=A0A5E4LS86_9ARCH|nr:Phenylalanine--tRNA ligase beta subunit [Candidatus Bilamarchaeum dharawalense]